MGQIKLTLKACRVNAGFNQKEIAEQLNKTKETIISWEKGKTIPGGDDLQKLAKIYGVPSDFIFLGDELALNEFRDALKVGVYLKKELKKEEKTWTN